jgi:glycosyltransferase domain-containing protein
MDLRDVTVVILSRGREAELSKTLKFWSQFDISVLVLHNTEKPLESAISATKLKYVVAKVPYGERCGLVAKYLKTKYAVLCSDDEVFLPSALMEMKCLLDEEPELTSVGALTVAVGKYGPSITGTFTYSGMRGYFNLEDSPICRLNHHFNQDNGYRNGAIYRLMRKDLMASTMNLFSQLAQFSTPYIYEVSGEIFVNAFGKTKYIETVYWLRNWINSPVGHKNWNRKLYFKDWVEQDQYRVQYLSWSAIMQNALGLPEAEFYLNLSTIVRLRTNSEEHEIAKDKVHRWALPESLKWILRKVLNPKSLPKGISQTLNDIEKSGVKVNRLEIEKGLKAFS